MVSERRKLIALIAALGAGSRLMVGCGVPDGAIVRCEPGTVADQEARACISTSAGAAGASGGGAGACEAGRLASDPKNCGACGRDCREAACENGACKPEVLAERLLAPYSVVVDIDRVVWASPARGLSGEGRGPFTLARGGASGGTPSALFGGAALRARGLAFTSEGEFLWGDLDLGSISKRGVGAGQATQLVTERANVNCLVLAGDSVYWTEGGLGPSAAAGGVYRACLAGGGRGGGGGVAAASGRIGRRG